MRIGSLTIAQQGIGSILEEQARISRAQAQLSSGRKDATAADNPADFAQGLTLDGALAQLDRYKRNTDLVIGRLGLEDNALASATDILQRIRELAVQANNATQDGVSRSQIAAELKQRLGELLQVANSGDGQGRYLFAGTNSGTPPFGFAPGGVAYGGDANTRTIAINPGTQLADGDNGRAVFLEVPTGNGTFVAQPAGTNTGSATLTQTSVVDATQWDGGSYAIAFTSPSTYEVRDSANNLVASGAYAPGQAIAFRGISVTLDGTPAAGDRFGIAPSSKTDVFAMVQGLIDTVSAGGVGAAADAARHNGVFNALQNLDRSLDHLLAVRAGVGARIGTAQDAQGLQSALSGQLQKALSGVRDTDFAQAVSQLQLQLTALQAAQQAFAKVQNLSLFDYLR